MRGSLFYMNKVLGSHVSLIALTVAVSAFALPQAFANPQNGTVSSGSATIEQGGAGKLNVHQHSQKVAIDWQEFNIAEGEHTQFHQPNSNAIALNRIHDQNPSQIFGQLSANGKLILINPNGMVFGPNSKVDTAGLVATTHKLSNADFEAGNYRFTDGGNQDAKIDVQGHITVQDAGMAAFVAPSLAHSGVIEAKLGKVELASASAFTLDFYGDDLIKFATDLDEAGVAPDDQNQIELSGTIDAVGGSVVVTAKQAREIVDSVINTGTAIKATGATIKGDKIVLDGGEKGHVSLDKATRVTSTKSVDVQSYSANLDGVITARKPDLSGGKVVVDTSSHLSIGGEIDVSGSAKGGEVDISSDGFSFAGFINAFSSLGKGGTVATKSTGGMYGFKGAKIDVSGMDGGSISQDNGTYMINSAEYAAKGHAGAGGQIDLTADSVRLLSFTADASGLELGGAIRIGGEYQGGKHLANDQIRNASHVIVNDTSALNAETFGANGDGGTVIAWADETMSFMGEILTRPGTQAGQGGFVEVSSGGDAFHYSGQIETGRDDRQGTVLFDPKNITITDSASTVNLDFILGYNFENNPSELIEGSPDNELSSGERFGNAVALDGNRLAVGVSYDRGAGDSTGATGAVHLYSFTDSDFNGASLDAIVGANYTGGKNIDIASELSNGDFFGRALDLDGTRLVVGAPKKGNVSNTEDDTGAVFLFSFDNESFDNGVLVGIIGDGHTGGKSINMQSELDTGDEFGRSVSLDGRRLAVGAPEDDGNGNSGLRYGAVYLFSFSSDAFSGGVKRGVIGQNYSGLSGFSIEERNEFGTSVSLKGQSLAVSSTIDKGSSGNGTNIGSVELFTFSNDIFDGKTHVGTIGSGYNGTSDINFASYLDNNDRFGGFITLTDDYTLYVSSNGDDGYNNTDNGSGAAFAFKFDDENFTNGRLHSVLGSGYTGENDIDTDGLSLGGSIAYDNGRIAIGNPSYQSLTGLVYLMDTTNTANTFTYGYQSGFDRSIAKSDLLALLDAGQDVILQANNDITLDTGLTVNNTGGDGGSLTLQAGRSLLLNYSIFSDNGSVSLIANDTAANGVVDAERDAGNAVITMASGTYINAGDGDISIVMRDGAGKTNSDTGDVTLETLAGDNFLVSHDGNAGDIALKNLITRTGTDSRLAIANVRGDILNQAPGGVLFDAGDHGRTVFYGASFDHLSDMTAILSGDPYYDTAFNENDVYGDAIFSDNRTRFAYRVAPVLTVSAGNASRTYGDGNGTLSYSINGLVNGDSASGAYSGEADISTVADATSDVGNYTIAASLGSLVSDYNYRFTFNNGTMNVTQAALNVAAGNSSRVYGDANPAFGGTMSGLKNNDVITVSYSTLADEQSNVGDYDIVALASGAKLSNYNVNYTDGTLNVTPASLSVVADDYSRVYGDANPSFTGTITGIKNNDLITADYATLADQLSDIGDYDITAQASGAALSNYNVSYDFGTLTVTPATLNIVANNNSRVYGDANPAFGGTITGLRNNDLITVSYSTGADQLSDVGRYDINAQVGGARLLNYNVNYTAGSLDVTPADLTVISHSTSRVYGDANPVFSGEISGIKNNDLITASFTSTADQTSDVGRYDITGSAQGQKLGNYAVTYEYADLYVNQAPLTVTANNASRVYGDANPAFSGEIVGIKNNDAITADFFARASSGTSVGEYQISGFISGDKIRNYTFAFNAGTLSITPAPLAITVDDAEKFVSEVNPEFTGNFTGVKNNDLITVSYSSLADTNSAPGEYAITADATGEAISNYDVNVEEGILTVNVNPNPGATVTNSIVPGNSNNQGQPNNNANIDLTIASNASGGQNNPSPAALNLLTPAAGGDDNCEDGDEDTCL